MAKMLDRVTAVIDKDGKSRNQPEVHMWALIPRLFCVAIMWPLLLSAAGVSAQSLQSEGFDGRSAPVVDAPGTVFGRVTASDSGAPIRGASVQIEGVGLSSPREVFTDLDGKYEFRNVAKGRYAVFASKTGYVAVGYGQRSINDLISMVSVGDSERSLSIDFALVRAATIVVKLLDESGDALPGFFVHPLQRRLVDGQTKMVPVSALGTVDSTDDRGEIRVFGLAPGDYFLAANAGLADRRSLATAGMRELGAAETFYPGTSSAASAETIHVAAGDEVSVAFPVVRAVAVRVSGTASTPTGTPLGNASIELRQRHVVTTGTLPISLSPDGTFDAVGVPPGEYVLRVRSDAGQGLLPVRVFGDDVDGLHVEVSSGQTIRGRIVVEDAATNDFQIRSTRVAPLFIDSSMAIAPAPPPLVRPDGTFELVGVRGIGVLRTSALPRPWQLKRVVVRGRDVADTPLDLGSLADEEVILVVGRPTTELRLKVYGDGNASRSDAVIVVFPRDRQQWTPLTRAIAAARPDQFGVAVVSGLPAGSYAIAAVESIDTGDERNPEVLSRLLQGSTALELVEHVPVDVRVTVATN